MHHWLHRQFSINRHIRQAPWDASVRHGVAFDGPRRSRPGFPRARGCRDHATRLLRPPYLCPYGAHGHLARRALRLVTGQRRTHEHRVHDDPGCPASLRPRLSTPRGSTTVWTEAGQDPDCAGSLLRSRLQSAAHAGVRDQRNGGEHFRCGVCPRPG